MPGGIDEILQVFTGLAQNETPGIFAMPFRVQPENPARWPMTCRRASAAIADDISGALDESCLRSRLRFDDLDVHRRSVVMFDQFAAAADDGTAAAAIFRLPILEPHLCRGVFVGGVAT